MGRRERQEAWRPPVDTKPTTCALCEKDRELTFHHLIPVTLHDNKWFKKNFSREQMDSGVYLCRPCHNQVHNFWDEKTLGKEFNTLEKLLATEQIQKFIVFAKKQK
jgi:5-methylcytosine-specific restriction endonuclease McrA